VHDEHRTNGNVSSRPEPVGPTSAIQKTEPTFGISRRQFIAGVAAAAGGLALSGGRVRAQFASSLPDPDLSGIEHFVVVMMENRSFDHYLGWTPGADGIQAGLSYVDKNGVARPTRRLQEYRGCAHPDPTHSYDGGHTAYNDGGCDGWLRAGSNDTFAISYYAQEDLGFHGKAVPQWTTFDRYFPAILGPTFPNRIYQHAGQTDRISNTFDISQLPTIWDRLADAGLKGRYYYNDLPVLALWGLKYSPISRRFSSFIRDAMLGRLPHVSYVDPKFVGQEKGDANDDHPHSDIRNGQAFLNLVYQAVTTGPQWNKTVLVLNYDEWGGFFDHVPPPVGPIPGGRRRSRQRRSPRFSRAVPADFSLGKEGVRVAPALRSHVHSEDDRVALGPRASYSARRSGEQSRGSAGFRPGAEVQGASVHGPQGTEESRLQARRQRPILPR
jgi:phospholipase C